MENCVAKTFTGTGICITVAKISVAIIADVPMRHFQLPPPYLTRDTGFVIGGFLAFI
jgi:hypothetical protein